MRNKYKHLRAKIFSFCEKRLLAKMDFAPDGKYEMYSLSGTRVENLTAADLQKNRERWKKVIDTLRDAANNDGDEKLKAIVNNDQILRMVTGMVYLDDGDSIDWLPQASEIFLQITSGAFTGAEEIMNKQRSDATEIVKRYAEAVRENISELRDAREEFEKHKTVAGAPLTTSLTTASGADATQRQSEIFADMEADEGELNSRQHALVELQRYILVTPFNEFTPANLQNFLAKLDLKPRARAMIDEFLVNELAPIVKKFEADPREELFAGVQDELLKKISETGDLPLSLDATKNAQYRKELIEIRDLYTARIAELNVKKKDLLNSTDYAKNRTEYLDFLAGTDMAGLVAANIVRPGYNFNVRNFVIELQTLNPHAPGITDAEIETKAGFDTIDDFRSEHHATAVRELRDVLKEPPYNVEYDSDKITDAAYAMLTIDLAAAKAIIPELADESLVPYLLAVWNQEPLLDYLSESPRDFNTSPTQNMFRKLLQRTFLDDAEAELLRQNDLDAMSVATMADIALLAEFKKPAAPADYKDELDAVLIDKLAEIFSEDLGGGTRRVQKAKFIETVKFLLYQDKPGGAAEAEAQAEWTELLTTAGVADADTIDVDLLEIEASLDKLAIGPKTHAFFKKIDGLDLQDKRWITSAKEVTLQAVDDLSVGGSKWWAMISEMPGYYLDGDLNEDLLVILNQRRALQTHVDAINERLIDGDLGKKQIQSSEKALREMVKAQKDALDTTDLAKGVYEHIEGATHLLKSAEFIEEQLGDDWRELPPHVREIAFWLAMNKAEKTPDGKISLSVAKDFIAGWHRLNAVTLRSYIKEFASSMPPNLRRQFYLNGMRKQEREVFSVIPEAEFAAREDEFVDAFSIAVSQEDRRRIFVLDFLSKSPAITDEDRENLSKYRAHLNGLEELEGRNIMDMAANRHGISVRPLALQALMGLHRERTVKEEPGKTTTTTSNTIYASMLVGRWELDRDRSPEEQAQVTEALNIALDGPPAAKMAVIDAFVNRRKTKYRLTPGGPEITVEPSEASEIVNRAVRHLNNMSNQHHPMMEKLEQEDLFENPLEVGLRATIDTMRDLWAGDMVDKAKVIGGLLATAWLLKTIWKKGDEPDAAGIYKLAKFAMIGAPILIVANSAYKTRSGRDLLGEWLHYVPKGERKGAFEQYRRHLYGYEEFKEINTNAGHEAMKQISGPESNVTLQELLAWRDTVQASGDDAALGYKDYQSGAPAGLDISNIQYEMGIDATENDAYRLAFKAFSSVCVWTAAQHDRDSSNTEHMADFGADYLRTHYVDLHGWRDRPDIQKKLAGRTMKVSDVIINEMHTPELYADLGQDRTFIEWLADGMGWTYKEAEKHVVRLSTKAQLGMQKGFELGKDALSSAWDFIDDNAENYYDYLRVKGELIKDDFFVNKDASWRGLVNTLSEFGIFAKKAAVGTVEFVVDTSAAAADITLDGAVNAYRIARSHQLVGNATGGLELAFQTLFGANIADLIAARANAENDNEYVEKIADEDKLIEGIQSNLDGMVTLANGIDVTNPAFKTEVKKWRKALGASFNAGTDAEFARLSPYEKMMVYEHIKRRLHSLIVASRVDAVREMHKRQPHGAKLAFPISIDTDWTGLGGANANQLADEIENSFGWNTLLYIGAEQNLAGLYAQWVATFEDGKVRPPLEFLHWASSYVTFDSAPFHMLGEIELFKDHYLGIAEKEFEGDPKKDEKIQIFAAYLETVLTNTALEAAMGARHAEMLKSGVHKADGKLALKEEMATHLLEYLKTLRGSSPDARQLGEFVDESVKAGAGKDHFMKVFESFKAGTEMVEIADDDELLTMIQSELPQKGAAPKKKPAGAAAAPPAPLTATEQAQVDAILAEAPGAITTTQMDKLLDLLASADPARRAKIGVKFDDIAKHLDLDDAAFDPAKFGTVPDLFEKAKRVTQGVADTAITKNLREKMSDFFVANPAAMRDMATLRDLSLGPDRLQDIQETLDQGIVKRMEGLISQITTKGVDAIRTESRAQLETDFINPLAELYALAGTDKVKDPLPDSIMMMVEVVLYTGERNQTDEGGKKGFDKLKQYMLVKYGVTDMPEESYYYFEDKWGINPSRIWGSGQVAREGSKLRLQRTARYTNGSFETELKARLNFIKERFK